MWRSPSGLRSVANRPIVAQPFRAATRGTPLAICIAVFERRVGRLPGFDYRGPRRYFLTFCVRNRVPAFLNGETADACVEEFCRAAVMRAFEITVHCVMPDHVHLLVTGLAEDSHLPSFASLAKQLSGFRCRGVVTGRLWQDGYYDHILRDEEKSAVVIRYILENPVRSGLVRHVTEYPYVGSQRYTREQLIEGACMEWGTHR